MKAGFTLLEILVACALVVVLFAIALPATSKIGEYNARTKSISNLRQIGIAAKLYANEHSMQLPGQPVADEPGAEPLPGGEQWPALFCSYLSPSNPLTFVDPSDPSAARLPLKEILSNTANRTGYIYNGFNELGQNGQPPATVPLNLLSNQTETVLLAQKKKGAARFCLNPIFQPVANLLDFLNPGAYDGGAHYLFVDGSVRYIKWQDYSNNCWSINKDFPLPLPQLPPFPFNNNQAPAYVGEAPPAERLPLATIR